MATTFDEFQRRLLSNLYAANEVPQVGPPAPGIVPPPMRPAPPMGPQMQAPNPWLLLAQAPPVQAAPRTPPPPPKPQKDDKREEGRAALIQRLIVVFPDMPQERREGLTDQQLEVLFKEAQRLNWQPQIAPPPSLAPPINRRTDERGPAQFYGQMQPQKDDKGVFGQVTDTLGEAFDLATDFGTGFGVSGEGDGALPHSAIAAHAGSQMRAGLEQMEEGRNAPLREEHILEPLREQITPEVIAQAMTANEQAIAQLEAFIPPTEAQQRVASNQLEKLRIEKQQLEALNFVLYGVEPEQPDPSLWQEALQWGGNILSYADKPREMMRPIGGTLVYLASQNTPAGRLIAGAVPWAGLTVQSYGADAVAQMYELEGPLAVWEEQVAHLPEHLGMNELEAAAWHLYTDSTIDPLSYTGVGAVATRGIPLVGRTMAGLNAAANLPGDLAIGGVRGLAKTVGKAPGIRTLGELSEEAVQRVRVLEPLKDTGTQLKGTFLDEEGVITAPRVHGQIETIRTPQQPVQRAGLAPEPEPPKRTPPTGPVATKADPLADLTGLDAPLPRDAAPTPPERGQPPRPRHIDGTEFNDVEFEEFLGRTGVGEDVDTVISDIANRRQEAAASAVQRELPEPERPAAAALDTPREQPYIATKAERTAQLKAGEKTVLDPMFANRRVIDRIEARLTTLPRDVANRVRTAIAESNINYNRWHEQLEGTKYPKGRFYQKIGDQSLTAQEGSIRQVELFRELTGEAPPPGNVQLLKGVEYTKEQSLAAIVERIVYGTDKQANDAINAFERLWLPRDEAWGRDFLLQARSLRSRWAAVSEPIAATARQVDDIAPPAAAAVTAPKAEPADLFRSTPSKEPGYVYHATSRPRLYDIEDSGIVDVFPPDYGTDQLAWPDGSTSPRSYWSDTPETTKSFAPDDGMPVLLRRPKAGTKVERGTGDIAVESPTPTSQVEYWGEDGQWHRLAPAPPKSGKTPSDLGFADTRLIDHIDAGVGRQPDDLTRVADDVDAELAPFLTRQDKLARFVRAGVIDGQIGKMLDETVPIGQAVENKGISAPLRTTKQVYSAQQKKIFKELEKAGTTEMTRWDLFELTLLRNKGNIDNAIKDFAAISGMNANEFRRGFKQLIDFFNGARNAVSHAWQYNLPRLGYNAVQDTATDAFALAADGQIDAAVLAGRMMREELQKGLEMSRYRPTQKIGKALSDAMPGTAARDVDDLHRILNLSIGDNVAGLHGARYETVVGAFIDDDTRTWWTKKFGKAGSVIAPDFARQTRTMLDDIKRIATKTDFMQRNIGRTKDEFYDYVRSYAAKSGLDGEDIIRRLEAAGSDYHGLTLFDDAVVRQVVGGGKGEHLARRWRAHLNALDGDARKHMERYLFSYRQTKLDKGVGQVFLFHYWMTRASVLHARLALDHPLLLATYVRTWDGMQDMEQDNLPQWAKYFVGLNVGPYGMQGLISPAGLLVGLGVVLDLHGINPNESFVQQVLGSLPVNPIIMAAASVYVNDRTPDLTGTNQVRQFYRAAANFLNAEAGQPLWDGVLPDHVAQGTRWVQELARAVLPGGKPLSGPSPEERDTQAVQFYASQVLQEQGLLLDENGAPTDQANQVMANIDAGLYAGEIEQEALERFTTDTLAGRVAMMTFPFQSTTPGFAAEQRTLNREGGQQERGQVVALPTSTGIQYGSTAQPMTPEQAAADLTVQMADAGDPQATELLGLYAQQQAIGGPEFKETFDTYYNLLFGAGPTLQAEYGGTAIDFGFGQVSYDDWEAMPEDARETVLAQWLAHYSYFDTWREFNAERRAFEEANPLLGEFRDWQDDIRKLGPSVALTSLLKDSPSFAAWWQNQDVAGPDVQMVLMRPEAFLASEGIRPSIWDSTATGGPSFDPGQISPLDITMIREGGAGGGYGDGSPPFEALSDAERIEMLNEDLAEYYADYVEFDAKVRRITGGRGYDEISNASMLGLRDKLPDPPRGSDIVRAYMDWMTSQPPNSDTSVEAFIRWYARMEKEELAA